MTRVESDYSFGVPVERAPDLDLGKVRELLQEEGLLDREAGVVEFLEATTARYMSLQARHAASATPSQVRDYANRIEKAVAALSPGPDPATLEAALSTRETLGDEVEERKRKADLTEASWLSDKQKFNAEDIAKLTAQRRAEETTVRAVMSPFDFADLQDRLDAFAQSVRALADDVRATKAGSGERLEPARQRELATWFWEAFAANVWPIELTAEGNVKRGSLMPELLRAVLTAAGEERRTITAPLNDAKPMNT